MASNEREPSGRFAKGHCPSRRGRPPGKRKALQHPSDFRRVILRVGRMRASLKLGAKTETMTLFDASFYKLAMGSTQGRLAAMNFIDMVMRAATAEDHLDRSRAGRAGNSRQSDMVVEIKRKPNGQFEKGATPHPAGRTPATPVPLPSALRGRMLNIANRLTPVKMEGGKIQKLTLFEAKVLELGSGNSRNRLAIKDFIEQVLRAANVEHNLREVGPSQEWIAPSNELDGPDDDPELTEIVARGNVEEFRRAVRERLMPDISGNAISDSELARAATDSRSWKTDEE